jgi:hypothetical protein
VPPDLADWNKIKDSKNLEDLTAYVEKYPNSPYAQLALVRIRASNTAGATDSPDNTRSTRSPAFLINGEMRTKMKLAVTKQDVNASGGLLGMSRVKTAMAFKGRSEHASAAIHLNLRSRWSTKA